MSKPHKLCFKNIFELCDEIHIYFFLSKEVHSYIGKKN